MITQDELKELLDYNPDTGIMVWIKPRGGIRKDGVAGSKHHSGYLSLTVKGKYYLVHRLIFLYMTGRFPTFQVDHINGIKNDNRWENLREVTAAQNQHNIGLSRNNTSGVKGVYWSSDKNKWRAGVKLNGRRIHVGDFKCLEEATLAVKAKRKELHDKFANNG